MTAMNGLPATQKQPMKLPQGNKAVTRQELFDLLQQQKQKQNIAPSQLKPTQVLGGYG